MPKLRAVLSLLLLAVSVGAVNDVIVKYNKLFVDKKEYIIKGISYNPAPLSFLSGTGLCSYQTTFSPYDLSMNHCYDSDFWDGYTYPGRNPAPPSDGWFSPIWKRDLPRMASIGVNTLRIYNVNPSNFLAYQRYNGQYNITQPGKDHVPFLDECAENNIKVVWPLFSDKTYLMQLPEEQLQFYMRTAIEEAGNHSALLMYSLGNELNYVNNSDYDSFVKIIGIVSRLINYARDYQRTYWNRLIPFTIGTDDNNAYFDWLAGLLPVDVFMPNAGYRSTPSINSYGFFNLWSGSAAASFSGFYKLSCKYQFPTLIGEMNPLGYMSPPNNTPPYPLGFPSLWRDLMRHVSQGAIGGFFFEWNDENWKKHWDPPQDLLGINTLSVACDNTGCSDQANVFLADAITPKGWEYQAVCCGKTDDGSPYNYGTDVFQLLGRDQQTLDTATNDCPTVFWDGSSFPARGGYVSQYYVYPPNEPTRSVPPTTTPPPTTPAPPTPSPAPATPTPAPTSHTQAPVAPTPTVPTTHAPTQPPSSVPSTTTSNFGITSNAFRARSTLLLVAIVLAAFVLLL